MKRRPIYEDVYFWDVDAAKPSIEWIWPRLMIGAWLLMIGCMLTSDKSEWCKFFGFFVGMFGLKMLRKLGVLIAFVAILAYLFN